MQVHHMIGSPHLENSEDRRCESSILEDPNKNIDCEVIVEAPQVPHALEISTHKLRNSRCSISRATTSTAWWEGNVYWEGICGFNFAYISASTERRWKVGGWRFSLFSCRARLAEGLGQREKPGQRGDPAPPAELAVGPWYHRSLRNVSVELYYDTSSWLFQSLQSESRALLLFPSLPLPSPPPPSFPPYTLNPKPSKLLPAYPSVTDL